MRSKCNTCIFIILVFITICFAVTGCAFVGRPVVEFPDGGLKVGFQGSSAAAGELAEAEKEAMKYPLIVTDNLTGWADYVIYSDHVYFYSGEISESLSAKEGIHYLGEDGREISTDTYDKGYPFHEGLACVRRDGKYGYINPEGEVVIPFAFDDAAPFMEGLAYFATPQEYGFMDYSGTPVFTLDCDSVSSFQEGFAFFFKDGKYGYLDKTGTVVIAPAYDYAEYFEDGLALVGKAGKSGMIDKNGKEIVPLLYDSVERCGDYMRGYLGEDKVCYDRNGQICPLEAYEEAREEYWNSYAQDSAYSGIYQDFLQKRLEELKALSKYDEVSLDGVCFKVKKDGKYGYLDLRGEVVVPIEYNYVDESADYNHEDIRVLTRWGVGDDFLIRTGQTERSERKESLLKNAITPRIPALWKQYLQEEYPQCINSYRYFMLDNSNEMILYQVTLLHTSMGFPWSDSAFYRVKDGEAELLLSGYECGGSMRGDWVHLWRDQGSDTILLGITGSIGGFGGYASYNCVYELRESGAVCIYSSDWVGQNAGNYSEEYLLQNAELLYGDEGKLCTKDNVLEMGSIEQYTLNDKLVTMEEYEKAQERYVRAYSRYY